MGQKINPTIFRLGVNKTWKTEFFEKKNRELPLYTFKNLEIKNYIERFLEKQGIFVHDYKQHYSGSTLNLYVSYFVSSSFIINTKSAKSTLTLMNSVGNTKLVNDKLFKAQRLNIISVTSMFEENTVINCYRIKKYLKPTLNSINLANKTVINSQKFNNKVLNLKIEGVLNSLFRVLSLFTGNKFDIIITFRCLNKDLSFLKETQNKNFILLQKFKGTPFLKEGAELLFHVIHNRSSASLLTKFIADQIKKTKRQKLFLTFLKQTLITFTNSNFACVKGIKILIKGRLNGVPRASHKIITIGDVPVQSINANVDYSQLTVHNANGSYGVKVWIIEK